MVFTILVMGTYWVTEVIPLPVTALIPMVVFPVFGIRDTDTVVQQYFKSVTFLIFGGLVLAAAIEHQNLHRRFALRVLLLFGTDPKRLLLGFMSATAFLSAWMNNTAVTAMMLPIARAVLDEIGEQGIKEEHEMEDDLEGKAEDKRINQDDEIGEQGIKEGSEIEDDLGEKAEDKRTNHDVLSSDEHTGKRNGDESQSLFGKETGLHFGSWTLYCFPQMVVCILVIWLWLQYMYLPRRCKSNSQEDTFQPKEIKKVIQRAYDDLGPMRFAEWAVLGHFLIIVVLWITQDPNVFPGWGSFFPTGLSSATPTILITISLFMFPSERPLRLIRIREQQTKAESDPEMCLSNDASTSTAGVNDATNGSESRPKLAKVKSIPALISWDVVHEKMPWGVLIVVGGGFALADGCMESGLSAWLAEQFKIFYGIPPFAMALIIAIIISVLTEFTANAVTVAIFLPIVAEMAVATRINPLYLMVTATVSSSFAFMLPVATPPNAIAFSSKEINVIDMVKTGCLLNFLCICVLLFCMNTLGRLIFNIAVFPDWANSLDANTTDIYNVYNSTSVPF
ncbi:solute carrier family 13 member 3-like [Strongylocentrotus purpuratus]|uniref:Citrate transporter-like domain-containing protein n=1 Tax=Strongylocentrotus purpuratus TaxID=7668 RepID=A0A7M7PPX7_STRPU|nr:solute carrier family 13 member 3-like [Strongylocentrotus purpuratus]